MNDLFRIAKYEVNEMAFATRPDPSRYKGYVWYNEEESSSTVQRPMRRYHIQQKRQ